MTIIIGLPSLVEESIEFLTDILRSRDGTEQRLCIRSNPRSKIHTSFSVLKEVDRTNHKSYLNQFYATNIQMPMWQYATKVTASALSTATRIYYDYDFAPVAVGEKIVILDKHFGYKANAIVSAVSSTYVDITTTIGVSVLTTDYVAYLPSGTIGDNSKINVNGIISSGDIDADFINYTIENGSSYSLTMFDSLPVLIHRPLEQTEITNQQRNLIDFTSGAVEVFNHVRHVDFSGDRKFRMDRSSAENVKFWRKFLNTIKGSWKPFLLPTWMSDFTVASLTANANHFDASPGSYEDLGITNEAFKRIQIEYADGSVSYHRITAQSTVGSVKRFTVTPNIPNDSKVATFRKISRLLKVYGSDTITISHGYLFSEISMSVNSTDFG